MHETGRSREDSREVMEQNGCIKEQSRKRIGNRIHSIGCLGLCILAFVLLLGLIACGRNADEAKQQGMETGTDSEEITHIIMTYQTKDSSRTEQLDAVMEAVNAIAREEIGVEVELLQVDAVQSRDLYPLLLTQGKRIDLMVLNYEDITSYIKQNMLMPLDSLLELAGQGIVNLSGQSGDLLGGALIDGSTYGISVPEETRGKCGAVWVPMRYLEEVDFYYSENHIYSLDELDVLFARLKEKHPEKYPFGQLCGNYSFTTSVFFLNDYDALGSSNWTGVLDLRKDSGIFVNYYETDGYYNWLTYLRKWYLDGYIYPDAAVTNVEPKELLRSGIIMSIPKTGMPFVFDEENCGEPMAALRTTSVISMGGSSTDIFWTLPVTCKEPEAAMRFLNLMYTNEQVVNLLAWGIEGEHYVLREDGSVSLP